MLQYQYPTRGDWASQSTSDLKLFGITEDHNIIKHICKRTFSRDLKTKSKYAAHKYLQGKSKTKGQQIRYLSLDMSEYLRPNESGLSIEEKKEIFAIRNGMIVNKKNFKNMSIPEHCICGFEDSDCHIYNCDVFNDTEAQVTFDNIYSNMANINILIQAYIRMSAALKLRSECLKAYENI